MNRNLNAVPSALQTTRQTLISALADLGTAALRLLPPEVAHDLGMFMLAHHVMEILPAPYLDPLTTGLRVSVPGIGDLAHPLGLAAGFDKHCLAPKGFARMGFALLEIGTVTPRPQPGSPKPRMFRQSEQLGLINRMGFNSDGASAVAERLGRLKWRHDQVPLGVNCGKNKDTPAARACGDYLQVIELFKDLAAYLVINISSPNTPGLRDLATPAFVEELAAEMPAYLPKTWVKLDPDMSKREFQLIVAKVAECGFQGIIVSNTHRVTSPEVGGQSGHPLATQSTVCLEWAYEVHKGRLPMIATGGVLSGADVLQKMIRGASAVQVYTGLIYRGPWVVPKLLAELSAEMRLRGITHVQDVIGSYGKD